ncbi:MAG TPA: hypothetical protein VN033_10295 [Vulgatibacter sp.]|nr:hypothetical protein [Vulgatibacter sp.]
MAWIEGLMQFARQQALTGTSDTPSSNTYDAGTAQKVFAGTAAAKLGITVSAIGGTDPTFRARLVGADNSALSTNPEIIADTGVVPLAPGDIPKVFELSPAMQKSPKRHYGVIFTLGGTTPTATANAHITSGEQSGGLVSA